MLMPLDARRQLPICSASNVSPQSLLGMLIEKASDKQTHVYRGASEKCAVGFASALGICLVGHIVTAQSLPSCAAIFVFSNIHIKP
jgi:hypothetical protein